MAPYLSTNGTTDARNPLLKPLAALIYMVELNISDRELDDSWNASDALEEARKAVRAVEGQPPDVPDARDRVIEYLFARLEEIAVGCAATGNDAGDEYEEEDNKLWLESVAGNARDYIAEAKRMLAAVPAPRTTDATPTMRSVLQQAATAFAEQFSADGTVDGGDLVEWFAEWRLDAIAALAAPVLADA